VREQAGRRRPEGRPSAARPPIDVAPDPAVAEVLREVIRQDAVRTDQPERAEGAREILSGRVRASDVPCYAAYAKVLSTGLDAYVAWRDELPEAERTQHERSALDYVASVRAEATLILTRKVEHQRQHQPQHQLQHRADGRAASA
jgi:hypothetical protein